MCVRVRVRVRVRVESPVHAGSLVTLVFGPADRTSSSSLSVVLSTHTRVGHLSLTGRVEVRTRKRVREGGRETLLLLLLVIDTVCLLLWMWW